MKKTDSLSNYLELWLTYGEKNFEMYMNMKILKKTFDFKTTMQLQQVRFEIRRYRTYLLLHFHNRN